MNKTDQIQIANAYKKILTETFNHGECKIYTVSVNDVKSGKPVTLYVKEFQDGSKFRYTDKDMTILHNPNGPAIEYADGRKDWYKDGKYIRSTGKTNSDIFGDEGELGEPNKIYDPFKGKRPSSDPYAREAGL